MIWADHDSPSEGTVNSPKRREKKKKRCVFEFQLIEGLGEIGIRKKNIASLIHLLIFD